jgi:hypothetical protein
MSPPATPSWPGDDTPLSVTDQRHPIRLDRPAHTGRCTGGAAADAGHHPKHRIASDSRRDLVDLPDEAFAALDPRPYHRLVTEPVEE